MASKLSIVFLLYLSCCISQRSFVAAKPRYLVTTGYLAVNYRIMALFPFEYQQSTAMSVCNGTLTDFPGEITITFGVKDEANKEIHCTWTLQAPVSHQAYVRNLQIIRSSTGIPTPLQDAFNDAPVIEVFEGTKPELKNRLYWFENSTLNDCISKNRTLTIDLHHRVLADYSEEKVIFQYGIIDDSLLHLRDIATFADIWL